MAEPREIPDESGTAVSDRTLGTLERLDNLAHVIVAVLFILMALSVVIYTGALFVRQMPLIAAAFHPAYSSSSERAAPPAETTPVRSAVHETAPGEAGNENAGR